MNLRASNIDPRRLRRPRVGLGALAFVGAAAVAAAIPAGAAADNTFAPAPGSPPSAIGNEAVYGIAVSPIYNKTGLVAVMSTPMSGCKSNCQHLWISHDGGATWARAAATNWDGGPPVIGVDASGHDIIFTSSSALERSDDGGQTWTPIGNLGFSSLSPRFTNDGIIAVGGVGMKPDYMYRNGSTTQTVTGSGGTFQDEYFMLSPTWPSGGTHSPALLAAADPHTQLPVIERCDGSLACSGATTLSGAQPFSAPAKLVPSTGYADDGTVFAQTGRGIYKSTDGGLTFTPLSIGQAGATTTATPMMALAPGYREAGPIRTAYVAVFQAFVQGKTSHTAGGIYRTVDGGATWAPLDSPGPFDQGAFGVAIAPDGRLFGGYMSTTTGHAGLLCSTDGGSSWQASCPAVVTHGRNVGVGTRSSVKCGASACVSSTPNPSDSTAGAGSLASRGNAGGNHGGGTGLAAAHTPTRMPTFAITALIVAGVLAAAAAASAVVRRTRRSSAIRLRS